MFAIDTPSAVPAAPAPAAQGAPGFFTNGDPVAGTPGTTVDADFLNGVMMELIGILTGVGVAPAKANRGQIAASLPKISGNSATFPSGIILNWGNDAQADGSGKKTVTFATPFQQGVLLPLVVNQAGGPPSAFHGVGNQTKTQMDVWSAVSAGQAAGQGTAFYWFALGR